LNDKILGRAFSALHNKLQDNVTNYRLLARETTMRVGGPAAIFAVTDTIEQLETVIEVINEWDLKLFVIGKGSNILVSDDGYPGVVLRLGSDFMRKRIDGRELRAGAGISLPLLVQEAARNLLDGLSFGVGIPGSLGGAIKMNAGAHEDSIGSKIKKVLVIGRDLKLKSLDSSKIDFSYRMSSFDPDDIIVEATLELQHGEYEKIKSSMEENFNKRKQSQPLNYPNAGSVFKNASSFSAGFLIEKAGCKGLSVGDAQVSEKHANFIINKGNATATNVFMLVRLVQQRVFEMSGMVLEPEIQFLGEFENTLIKVDG
jgi:UDP-N-acetylmuramate dehydrogenase